MIVGAELVRLLLAMTLNVRFTKCALQIHNADQLMPSDKQLHSSGTIALAQPHYLEKVKTEGLMLCTIE